MIEADKLLKKTPGELIHAIYTLDSENDLLKDENKRLQEKLNLLLSRSNGKKSEDSKQLEQQPQYIQGSRKYRTSKSK